MSALGDTPTIDEVFNNLTTNLRLIKSCSMNESSELRTYYKRNDILSHIFSFPSHIAIAYIDVTLKEIEDIKSLGDKIVNNIKKYYDGSQNGLQLVATDQEPDVTEEDIKRNAKEFIRGYLDTNKGMLVGLRKEIIARTALITDGSAKNQETLFPENLNSPATKAKSKQKLSGSYDSFRYTDYDNKPDNIKLLCKALISKGFIDKKTSLTNFSRVFSGKKIETPIKWTGNLTELAYFIKLIHNILKKVESTRQQHFKIAATCFVQDDGTSFDSSKMRGQKKPSKAAELEKLTKLL